MLTEDHFHDSGSGCKLVVTRRHSVALQYVFEDTTSDRPQVFPLEAGNRSQQAEMHIDLTLAEPAY
jgi:hypothetical protein